MADIGFNSEELAAIAETFGTAANEVKLIGDDIADVNVATIKANWSGDEANIAGRDRDLNEIVSNVRKIENNLRAVQGFLSEKNTDFSKVNYK